MSGLLFACTSLPLRPYPEAGGATWTQASCHGPHLGPQGLPSPQRPPSSPHCATPFQMLSLEKAIVEGEWPRESGPGQRGATLQLTSTQPQVSSA